MRDTERARRRVRFAGHGLLFPGFSAGVVYNTPDLAGLSAHGRRLRSRGQFGKAIRADAVPAIRGRDPILDAEHLFASSSTANGRGSAANTDLQLNPNASGVNGGGASLSVLSRREVVLRREGLGLYVPMENSPLFADEQGVLRNSRGYVGMASLTFGDTKIAGGFGVTELKMTQTEAEPFATLTIPSAVGISAESTRASTRRSPWRSSSSAACTNGKTRSNPPGARCPQAGSQTS